MYIYINIACAILCSSRGTSLYMFCTNYQCFQKTLLHLSKGTAASLHIKRSITKVPQRQKGQDRLPAAQPSEKYKAGWKIYCLLMSQRYVLSCKVRVQNDRHYLTWLKRCEKKVQASDCNGQIHLHCCRKGLTVRG